MQESYEDQEIIYETEDSDSLSGADTVLLEQSSEEESRSILEELEYTMSEDEQEEVEE